MSRKSSKTSQPQQEPMTDADVEHIGDLLTYLQAAVDGDGDDFGGPDADARYEALKAKRAFANAAVKANEAQRMRVSVTTTVDVVSTIHPGDLEWVFQNIIEVAIEPTLNELTTPEGSARMMGTWIEMANDISEDGGEPFVPTATAVFHAGGSLFLDHELPETLARAVVLGSVEERLAELKAVSDELTEQRREKTARRNRLVNELAAAGIGSTTLARNANMSTTAVFKIIKKSS